MAQDSGLPSQGDPCRPQILLRSWVNNFEDKAGLAVDKTRIPDVEMGWADQQDVLPSALNSKLNRRDLPSQRGDSDVLLNSPDHPFEQKGSTNSQTLDNGLNIDFHSAGPWLTSSIVLKPNRLPRVMGEEGGVDR